MRYIIDFKNTVSNEDIQSYVSSLNGTIVKTFNKFEKIFVIDLPTIPEFDDNLHSHLVHDEAHPIQLLTTTVISDGGLDLSTYPQLEINTESPQDWWKNFVVRKPQFDVPSYNIPRLAQNSIVYVLDSGIKLDHPEFEDRPVSCIFSFNDDLVDYNGHGTALASVIAGKTCGITDATVKAVKIFQTGVATYQSDLLAGLNAIYDDFANSPQDFAIVNCSWSISKNSIIENTINLLIEDGMYFVAAAGNNGQPISEVTPASMPYVLTIGSFDENLNPCDFSNYTGIISTTPGPVNHGELDGWAPGKDIYAANINGSYGYVSGTSISSAILAAVLAANLSVVDFDHYGPPVVNFYDDNFNYTGPTVQDRIDHAINLALNRLDLVSLDDPKYADSVNRIPSLIHRQNPPTEFKLETTTATHSNGKYFKRIVYPNLTKKIEILGTLPPGVTVNSRGIINGIAPVVNEPQIQDIEMIAYDLNDQAYPFTFKLITLPPNYKADISEQPDTELNIILSNVTGPCTIGPCQPACQDNCAQFYTFCNANYRGLPTCSGTTKTGQRCNCQDSDKRLKKDITLLTGALDKLQSVNGVSYTYNDTAKAVGLTDETLQIGVIAQELEQVYPELVRENPNGFKSVAYERLTAILIEAVKELTVRVKKLEAQK